LISAFLAVTILVVVVGVIGILTDNTIIKKFDHVQQKTVPSLIALGHLRASFFRMLDEAVSVAFISVEMRNLDKVGENPTIEVDEVEQEQEEEEEEFEQAAAEMEKWLTQYEDVIWTEEERAVAQELHQLIQTLQKQTLELINWHHQESSLLEEKEALENSEELFAETINHAIAIASGKLEKEVSKAHQSADHTLVVNLIAIIISVLLAGFFGFFTVKAIATPITQLKKTAVKIGQGQLGVSIPIKSQDEIGVLAMTFNQMAKQLKTSHEQLTDYSRTLETKVEERTQALSQANEELETTLEHLKLTQQELIQSEKMAALGQLVAGIAHEVNTPLAAIRSSAETLANSLKQTMTQFPEVFEVLTPVQQQNFFALLEHSLQNKIILTVKEKRAAKKTLTAELKQCGIANPRTFTDTFISLGIYAQADQYLPLLQDANSDFVFETAYQLSTLTRSAENITTAVERASKVIFALKAFARYDKSGEKKVAKLQDGLETVLTLYHNQIKQGIELIKEYTEIAPIACYPDELNQVWTNILHNALQAMDYKGTLIVTISQQENYAVVAITDSGQGIPAEIKEQIFTPFFTTKAAGEGSGLGLDIVKKIIDKHDGKIEVDSEIGKGTTFSIWLPI
jgi:signal transduction histidine kinase